MDLGLIDKVVLVTGGAKGIGAAAVAAFVAEGARLVIVDRDGPALERLVTRLDLDAKRCLSIVADLTDTAACQHAIDQTMSRFGQLDVLIHNAGYNDGVSLDAPPEQFWRSLQLNLGHVFALTHYARAALCASRGAIVSVSSKVSVTGQGSTSGYAAAKGAINALTREWALALIDHGVRVNAVVPAECDTDQYQRWFASQPDPRAARESIEQLVPLEHRLTTPEEIADAIVWLASSRAAHITGQLMFVDGGYTHLDRAATHAHRKWGE